VLKKQLVSFVLIGILNTLVGYLLYALFIFIGFNYFLSVLFATILGVLFNFRTIGKFVFNSDDNKKIIKFVFTYVLVFCINILIIKIFSKFGYNNYILGLIAIVPCSIVSFLLNKYFVFGS
jgi:putative flippase GtrA